MSLSEICVQQHQHEQSKLKRLLLWGLFGSVVAHGIALGLSQFKLWQDPPDELAPIELIVAEPQTKPLPDPPDPAQLSTQTNDPAAAAASAPPRAAVVAPSPTMSPPVQPVALDTPEPLTDTQAESAFEEPQATLDPDAMVTEPTAAQSDSLRDLFQRLRESQAGSGATPSATAGSGRVPNAAAGSSSGVAATRSTSNGRGQAQGSRTVACENCIRPNYPQSALAAGVEGQPKVSVDINPDGSVRSVTLTRSSGNAAIDQAVIQAARRSRFRPVSGGASVPIEYDLSIEGSRRHREARRRGERQAVNLAPDPATSTEAAPPSAAASPSPSPAPSSSGREPSPGREPAPAASSEPAAATPGDVEPAAPPAPAPAPDPASVAAPAPVPAPAPAAPSFSAPAPAAESPAEP